RYPLPVRRGEGRVRSRLCKTKKAINRKNNHGEHQLWAAAGREREADNRQPQLENARRADRSNQKSNRKQQEQNSKNKFFAIDRVGKELHRKREADCRQNRTDAIETKPKHQFVKN